MKNKLAKLKYLPNNFDIIEEGDYVICAISGKKIPLEDLNYWNVEEQEAYFSYIEASMKKKNYLNKILFFPSIMSPNPLINIFRKNTCSCIARNTEEFFNF